MYSKYNSLVSNQANVSDNVFIENMVAQMARAVA